jgi:hypothetical protein
MHFDLKQSARLAVACMLITMFALPPSLLAQDHIVSSSDLQEEAVTASQAREKNVQQVRQFFSNPAIQKALKTARTSPEQIKTAVAKMSDSELAQLASRTQRTQADFAAGTLTDRDLVLIILGIVALILIIVAVR